MIGKRKLVIDYSNTLSLFTRCWGDKETTDSSLQAFNSSIASTNISFHVFSDKFVIKGKQKAQEGGKIYQISK